MSFNKPETGGLFPAANSAQRAASSTGGLAVPSKPGGSAASSTGGLAVPSKPGRSAAAQRAASSTGGLSGGLAVPSRQPRAKVALKPGHSPLDWAELNRNTPKHVLRGVPPQTPPPHYIRISKEELKNHKTKDNCWTSINGKVFNITPYTEFHPGGVAEIMKCAGRDGTALFNKYHSWVNADRMLENCFVGVLAKD